MKNKLHFIIALLIICFVSQAQDTLVHLGFRDTVTREFYRAMTSVEKFMLLMGWLSYWLYKVNAARIEAKGGKYIADFGEDNVFEMPMSCISCFVFIFIAPQIPSTLMDVHGYLSLYIYGACGSSGINNIITDWKKQKNE